MGDAFGKHHVDRARNPFQQVRGSGPGRLADPVSPATDRREVDELLDQARRGQRWLQASVRITHHLLADGADALALIAQETLDVAAADHAAIMILASSGDVVAEAVAGHSNTVGVGTVFPAGESLVGRAVREQEPLLLADVAEDVQFYSPHQVDLGQLMVVPMVVHESPRGALVLGRRSGAGPFSDTELDMAAGFVQHIGLAQEFSRARADAERLTLVEDRERIARDLHDHVIQRLFAVALGLHALAASMEVPTVSERLGAYVDDLDTTIREIRTRIFQLRTRSSRAGPALRDRVLDAVGDVREAFAEPVRVSIEGSLDSLAGHSTADNVIAVVREGLTNAARHADARRVDLAVRVGDEVVVEILDDGVGPVVGSITGSGAGVGTPGRQRGLDNLRVRAEELGGSFAIAGRPEGGTRLCWSAPLR